MLGAQKSSPSKMSLSPLRVTILRMLDAPLGADGDGHLVNAVGIEGGGQADGLGKLRGSVRRPRRAAPRSTSRRPARRAAEWRAPGSPVGWPSLRASCAAPGRPRAAPAGRLGFRYAGFRASCAPAEPRDRATQPIQLPPIRNPKLFIVSLAGGPACTRLSHAQNAARPSRPTLMRRGSLCQAAGFMENRFI